MGTEARTCPLCGGAEGRRAWESADADATSCARCGTVYVSRLSDRARGIASATYERIYARDAELGTLTRRSYEAVLDAFEPLRRTGRIVDVGCGAGGFVAVAEGRGWDAIGTEAAPGAGSLAAGSGARVVIGPEASRELPDGSADVVTAWEVIEHVDDPVGLLRECHRLLRRGGLVYLTTPNHASLQRRVLGRAWPRFHLEHLTYFDPRTIALAVARAGLRPVRVRTKNLDPFLIATTFLGRSRAEGADAPGARGTEAEGPEAGTWADRGREGLRAFIKSGPAGRAIADAVNGVVGRYGLGDTLVAEAERA